MANRTERPQGEQLATISNMVVKVHAEHLGRGPTKARTCIQENLVVCLLEDTMTPAQRTLRDAGRKEMLMEVHTALHETMEEVLRREMERLTERRVDVLINGTDIESDVTTHVFVLSAEPTK